jgi:hypothetical protein
MGLESNLELESVSGNIYHGDVVRYPYSSKMVV